MKMLLFVQSAQIAFFLGSIDLSDRLKVAEAIRSEMGDILNGMPTILPIPDDAPLEIPRIIYPSKDNKSVCNAAVNRFDFIYKLPEGEAGIKIKDFQKELPARVSSLNKLLFDKLKISSHRLGLILNYNALPKGGGLNFLKTNYLENSNDIAVELQLHKLTQGTIKGMNINNWIRLVASKKQLATGENHLLAISDINTSQTEKYDVTKEISTTFFGDALELSLKTVEEVLSQDN